MIWKYSIRKISEGYYSQSEYMLMSSETSRKWADDLYNDRLPCEASFFDARSREGTQWILLAADFGCTAFVRLPKEARKRITPKDRTRVERGQTVDIYACII
jgi:hypothetical protein